MEFNHKTVLLTETIDFLNIKKNGTYFDLTAGGAGLSREIALRLTEDGNLFSIDIDPDAIEVCKSRLKNFKNVEIIKENFINLIEISKKLSKYKKIDGIVLDLGVSSYQIDTPERGFSYKYDSKIDMRMSKEGFSAYDLINKASEKEIANIIKNYGEERYYKRIASQIIKFRKNNKKVFTTTQLVYIIKNAVPFYPNINEILSRVFQAFRIFVNNELENLIKIMNDSIEALAVGGRLIVITFHSLEDRIVKTFMKDSSKVCICPKEFPICVCDKKAQIKILTKKPIKASQTELNENIRSRSAKLRVCEKII